MIQTRLRSVEAGEQDGVQVCVATSVVPWARETADDGTVGGRRTSTMARRKKRVVRDYRISRAWT